MRQYIKDTIEGNIAVLELDRQEALNALNTELVQELLVKAREYQNNPDIKVIILIGNKNFAAGADIKHMIHLNPDEAKDFMFSEAFHELENLRMPTIAAISGYALGGGLELALTCDFRIASENAVLALPEINLGIFPGAGGTIRLPKLIGTAKAKQLIFLGTKINANEAFQIGLVSKVVAEEQLKEAAIELARELCNKPSLALSAAKRTINYAVSNDGNANAKEVYEWSNLFLSEDQKEGMTAFIERRKPIFTGK